MITVQNVSKTIGGRPIVRDVSFSVLDGSITGFAGPNGAGKSTTMRIMLGLIRADTGTARFDGVDYQHLPVPLRQVGSLLDSRALISNLRAGELLNYCARTQGVRPRAAELLEQVGLAGAERERVSHLSLGMRQRLGIATALIASPRNLVLDEPLNGLDPSGFDWLRGLLERLRSQGCAILLSSHIITELALIADDIVILNKGRIVLQGPLGMLVAHDRPKVLARTSQPLALLAAVTSHNGSGQYDPGGPVAITGLSAQEVFTLAATHRIVLDELTPSRRTLDDLYRDAVDPPRKPPAP